MKLPDLDHLPKDRRDWLEVWGNQWAPQKMMPGTCEACVWGTGQHAQDCSTLTVESGRIGETVYFDHTERLSFKDGVKYTPAPIDCLDV